MKRLTTLWRTFEEWASSIQSDKLLHYIAGKEVCAVATIASYFYVMLFDEITNPAKVLALSALVGALVGIVAGFVKDYIVDKFGDGTVDIDDFLATAYGSLTMCVEIEVVALMLWMV